MGKKGAKAPKVVGPEFVDGTGYFRFENGDVYIGEYTAHVTGLVWRHGAGKYRTSEGQFYEAIWKDDHLDENENLKIHFPEGDIYSGKVLKNKYNGPAYIRFSNGNMLSCFFENNKPRGDVTLTDYKGNCWSGQAGKERALLFREHVFSAELDEDRGKSKSKLKCPSFANSTPALTLQIKSSSVSFISIVDPKIQEELVFAKSSKTIKSEIDHSLKDSDWYRDFVSDLNQRMRVLKKIQSGRTESLDKEEMNYYVSQYLISKKILANRYKNRSLPQNYLERFFGDEYKNSCRPIRIFYPSLKIERERKRE